MKCIKRFVEIIRGTYLWIPFRRVSTSNKSLYIIKEHKYILYWVSTTIWKLVKQEGSRFMNMMYNKLTRKNCKVDLNTSFHKEWWEKNSLVTYLNPQWGNLSSYVCQRFPLQPKETQLWYPVWNKIEIKSSGPITKKKTKIEWGNDVGNIGI